MSTNKKFRIQNGVDVADGGISINDVTVIGADGKVVPAAIADAVAGLTSSDIADLQAQVSAILGTSPETLDTLQEIVAAFEGADSTLTGSVAQNASDIVTINNTLTNGVATPADIATLTASVTAEETRATAAESANAAAIAAANARTSGISTSSGSTDIQMTAEVDMDSNNIKNANDVYAARGFIDTIESNDLKVQTGTVDFEGSIVNFGSSQITGGGFGTATKAEVDQHLNVSAADSGDFLKWNGTDYEWTDYIQGRIASDQIVVEGTLKVEQPGSTIDWQDGLVHFGGSQVIVDEPTSANLAANKSYVDGGDSDVTAAASADATSKADAAEASAKAHADAGDTSLQGQIDIIVGSSPASLDTLQEIVSAFENADSTLTGAVAQNSTDIVAEASRATTAESGLQAQITSNDVDIASLQSLVADLDSDKTSDMTAETAARIAGDVANSAEVATEKSRAEGAEASLANDINVETARAVAVEGSLQSQIDAEQSSRIGGDQLLQNAIDAEEVARIAADAVLQANIDAEASARAGADNTLQSNIDTVSSAVSAITNGSPETLNQLTELVAAYEGADASLQTLIDNLGGDASALTGRVSTLESEMDATETATSSNASAITAEQVARSAADDDLQDAIDAEASARAAAVSAETTARQNAITAEANARILADNGLQSQIDALDNSTTGDKSDLQAQITSNDNDIAALQSRAGTIEADYATQASLNTEISRASSAEAVNAAAISDEQTRATAAEQSNAAAITQEILDRQSADAVLQSQIDFIEENTDPAALDSLTEIVSAFQSADSSTLGVVNSNTGRISALESGVVAIEAWDTDNVSEGQVNLYFTESRAKACVGADNGSCIDYNETSGKFSLDLSETAGALVPDNSTNSDKLDGQHGSHYRIDVYDVNGTVVN
jgi:hypothetical protein